LSCFISNHQELSSEDNHIGGMLASSAVDHSFGIGMMCPSGVYLQTVVSVEAIGIGLLCLVPLSAKFQVTVSFIGGGNQSTRRKPLICLSQVND